MINVDLLEKYDLPIARYTSYPTVPYWDFSTIDEKKWKDTVIQTFQSENNEVSIYIHLPFCENLCTFCACTKRITKNHGMEDGYINAVLNEWAIYLSFLPSKPVIREIHLGGGTPTFFSPPNLLRLLNGIISSAVVAERHEFSIEVHPTFTTEEHLKQLASVGFNRISVGVQDFDPKVQHAINRHQTFEKTSEVVEWARKYNYHSVNVDLVYGLPHQTVSSVEHTISLINKNQPRANCLLFLCTCALEE
jgi:oxygen-independent coproporphyrinogen-3 oxidase